MNLYTVEVRAEEDFRLLGRVSLPVPPYDLPDAWAFPLRNSVTDLEFKKVTLRVAEFVKGSARWKAFSVPAALWAEIKDKVR